MKKRISRLMDNPIDQDDDSIKDRNVNLAMNAAWESFRIKLTTKALKSIPKSGALKRDTPPTTHPFNLPAIFDRVDEAIDANADLAQRIMDSGSGKFGAGSHLTPGTSKEELEALDDMANEMQIDKARSTIRQMYRDWSAEGAAERKICYDPVLKDVAREFYNFPAKKVVRVLVPGAGLSRLAFEIACRGFSVEANEVSWQQTLASNWILNATEGGVHHDLYPFAAEFSNVVSREDQLRAVRIPDVHPGSSLFASDGTTVPSNVRMRATTGDFCTMYKTKDQEGKFDTVATVFFIDTAPNVFQYIEAIRNCLKPGGIWINLGPLLWHFEDRAPTKVNGESLLRSPINAIERIEESGTVELTNEEVLLLVQEMGFDIEQQEPIDNAGYIQNTKSMLQNVYKVSHWVARKRT